MAFVFPSLPLCYFYLLANKSLRNSSDCAKHHARLKDAFVDTILDSPKMNLAAGWQTAVISFACSLSAELSSFTQVSQACQNPVLFYRGSFRNPEISLLHSGSLSRTSLLFLSVKKPQVVCLAPKLWAKSILLVKEIKCSENLGTRTSQLPKSEKDSPSGLVPWEKPSSDYQGIPCN